MTSHPSGPERRVAVRRTPGAEEPIVHARLRGGREVALIDVSRAGALVEGPARVLPGTHVDLHVLSAAGRVLVRCRVARAFVHHLSTGAVVYRAGLAFERAVETDEPV